ncbi:Hsp20 family protein [Modicisalibacter luteus]
MNTAFSLEPLFRHSIGFDRFNDLFERAFEGTTTSSFPPYNVEKHGDNEYRIVLAVAGFTEKDLSIKLEGGVLTVSGSKADEKGADNVSYMHQGIAQRSFKLTYRLEDHIEVQGLVLKTACWSSICCAKFLKQRNRAKSRSTQSAKISPECDNSSPSRQSESRSRLR